MANKRIFDGLLSGKEWLIEQKSWQRPLQQVREAHFALGNGMMGSRGVMEEMPYDAMAGTYVSGIFDRFGAQIPELVNLPNPIVFRIDVEGEKLDPAAMDVVDHYRALDMKKGLLVRKTLYKTAHKEKIDYQSYRFISMYQKYIGAMVITVTPLDKPTTFTIHSSVDTAVNNRGMFTEGRKRHFDVSAISTGRNYNYTEVTTFEHQHVVGYAACVEVIKGGKKKIYLDKSFKISLKKGESATFIRYFTLVPSFYAKKDGNIKKISVEELNRGRRLGVKRLFHAHAKAWQRIWNVSDIIMEGSTLRQKAVRFNIYHLIIAGNADDRVSVGARTLSGEGYRGHIFWDAETFIFPFFVYTNPRIARSMLMYRWQRLDPAKKIAAAKGFRGALFPWESADSGEETTPSWFKDLAGDVLKIETLEEEHHIVADIAYAVNQYVQATGDENFMINYGLELLIETARFWASRVVYNKNKDRYETHHVMGPDEFHSNVKNNAFTNGLARFNLNIAEEWFDWAEHFNLEKLKKLMKKLELDVHEVRKWKEIASKIYIPYSKKKKLIEQFDGYFKLKDSRITQLDQHFMPVVPPNVHPVENGKTKLIKQADVIMLMFMLYEKFSYDEIIRHYQYYEKRTLHKSSLSPSIHSLMAARVGNVDKALTYLTIALQADLLDVHGNAAEGFHAASGGGVWQAMIMGFGGLKIRDGKLAISPLLPTLWKFLSYKIMWKGALIEIKILKNEIHVRRRSIGRRRRLMVEVAGIQKTLPIRKVVKFAYRSKL